MTREILSKRDVYIHVSDTFVDYQQNYFCLTIEEHYSNNDPNLSREITYHAGCGVGYLSHELMQNQALKNVSTLLQYPIGFECIISLKDTKGKFVLSTSFLTFVISFIFYEHNYFRFVIK